MQQISIDPRNLPYIAISPTFQGLFTQIDLLRAEGQIVCQLQFLQPPEGEIFTVIDHEFHLIAQVLNCELIFQRNDEAITLDISQVVAASLNIYFIINWSPRHLRLICGNRGGIMVDSDEQATPTVIPPPSLVEWARKQNLLPVKEYKSEEEFRQRIYSSLISLKDKIIETGAINSFWNILYNGSTIKGHLPKKETDIHPTIHFHLYEQMFMGSISVIPERQTGVGNLDFSFAGAVQGRGICEVFVEFKLAHSNNVYHGLEKQLPAYMKNKGIKYGAYCVLWFKCEWFDQPKTLSLEEMENELILRLSKTNYPSGIRTFIFNLGKISPASI
ncbi:MAG: hypothetical protein EA343_22335 [Nodularia sp. (in: Bacteria)]|nr:MAG: hypothetical protein EA343_22335 [Nodularia sp. (in: cyanobacteria)]